MRTVERDLIHELGKISDRLTELSFIYSEYNEALTVLSARTDQVTNDLAGIDQPTSNVVAFPAHKAAPAANAQQQLVDNSEHLFDVIQAALLNDARDGNPPEINAATHALAATIGLYAAQVKHPIERRALVGRAKKAIAQSLKFHSDPATRPMAAPTIQILKGDKNG
jgi:hypothetical protein